MFQVLVRGRDDANIDLHRRMAPYPIEFAVCQHLQQSGLGICGHVADFVEEQGASIGLLKAAPAHTVDTRKCAFFVAE